LIPDCVGEGIMSTLFTPFVEHVLHGSPQDLGFIVAAQIPTEAACSARSAPSRGSPYWPGTSTANR
jgi:hypothetical protein